MRSRVVATSLALALAAAVVPGCDPEIAGSPSQVTSRRVLAVRAEPAEAPPEGTVALTALLVDPAGERPVSEVAWSLCLARKPLTELGPASPVCVDAASTDLSPVDPGPPVVATVPKEACRLFGPDPPDAKPGEPAGRPVDPDATGGYHLPVVARFGEGLSGVALAQLRVTCGLAGATSEQLDVYLRARRPNQNPDPPIVTVDGAAAPLTTLVVKAGSAVTLRAGWPVCPLTATCGDGVCSPDETLESCADDCMTPKGCGGAEVYGLFDPTTRQNVLAREAIRVSWFSTAGTWAADRTGREPGDTATSSENAWTAPEAAGAASIWVVLRDDRGGAAWSRVDVTVE